jgi:hypothetical protein
MTVKLYKRAENVGWLGWIEDSTGTAMGYIGMDGSVLWLAGVRKGEA